MKTIWKFELSIVDRQIIKMPEGAEILSVQNQNETICIWAMVDPAAKSEDRTFDIFGTGNQVPSATRTYIGTVQYGPLVFHVFELI